MVAGDRPSFEYPTREHVRRHAPVAYRSYRSYRDFLRDEFIFACVYCLSRETWNLNASFFGIDHYRPKSRYPAITTDYLNLVYACNECNRIKGTSELPAELHPEVAPYGLHLRISETGEVWPRTKKGSWIVERMDLNRQDRIRWRRVHFEIYREAMEKSGVAVAEKRLRDFFGFPPNWPVFRRRSGAVDPYSGRLGLPPWY